MKYLAYIGRYTDESRIGIRTVSSDANYHLPTNKENKQWMTK